MTVEFVSWFLLVLLGLIMAGLGAGLETGAYCVNRVRLHVLEHSGVSSARLLAGQLAAPAAMIAALLIAHNTGVKLATYAAAELLHKKGLSDLRVIVLDAVIMMPLLFVLAETLPKNLFSVHADRLIYPFARPLILLVQLCRYSGLLPLIAGTSHLVTRLMGMSGKAEELHPRVQVQALVREGVGQGLLSDEQSDMVERVLLLGERAVVDEMIHWNNVVSIAADDSPDRLWKLAEAYSHARVPVIGDKGMVVGVIDVIDAITHDMETCPPIAALMQPMVTLETNTPLRDAMTQLQPSTMPIAVVTRQGKPVGIVTLKDLIEPITGELAGW